MGARRRRKLNIFRFLFLILLVAVIFNFTDLIKIFYPLPYRDAIIKYSARAGVDPIFLAAIMKTESHFNPEAVSARGARGLMQIMPETGRWIAQQISLRPYHPDLLFDPETNIRLGAWYIANLENEFEGNRVMVLAAYNGGRGNVRKWLEEEKISGNIKDIAMIPFPETRNFIKKVLRDYEIYKWLYNDEIYGGKG
ncbi:lytic transglycosylase domain-containing protein [Desulfallas sp. Bu1-1]|uniref:lytic transglycosylase domain-containing protein n=1 Tax=Desulfallas sp. Bu1-1 TaxID=2787620 RepID=UPI00189EFCA8|nr:lytic transglycosylase domain-containing protein [Desulfallas sp. Bu1-1]MBF7083928.1 lytic transglycosylase domain-containing protein [Desulfallas sp. Bu1-1]